MKPRKQDKVTQGEFIKKLKQIGNKDAHSQKQELVVVGRTQLSDNTQEIRFCKHLNKAGISLGDFPNDKILRYCRDCGVVIDIIEPISSGTIK